MVICVGILFMHRSYSASISKNTMSDYSVVAAPSSSADDDTKTASDVLSKVLRNNETRIDLKCFRNRNRREGGGGGEEEGEGLMVEDYYYSSTLNGVSLSQPVVTWADVDHLFSNYWETLEYINLYLQNIPTTEGDFHFRSLRQCQKLTCLELVGHFELEFLNSFLVATGKLPNLTKFTLHVCKLDNLPSLPRATPRRNQPPVVLEGIQQILVNCRYLKECYLELGIERPLQNNAADLFQLLTTRDHDISSLQSFAFIQHLHGNECGVHPNVMEKLLRENSTLKHLKASVLSSKGKPGDTNYIPNLSGVCSSLKHNVSLRSLEILYHRSVHTKPLNILQQALETDNMTLEHFAVYSWFDARTGFRGSNKHEAVTHRDNVPCRRKIRFLTDLNRLIVGRKRYLFNTSRSAPSELLLLSLQEWMAAMVEPLTHDSTTHHCPYGVYYNHQRLSMTFYLAQQNPYLVLPKQLCGFAIPDI